MDDFFRVNEYNIRKAHITSFRVVSKDGKYFIEIYKLDGKVIEKCSDSEEMVRLEVNKLKEALGIK